MLNCFYETRMKIYKTGRSSCQEGISFGNIYLTGFSLTVITEQHK